MATYDNSYSRVVAWLKVVLPLVALGILSTLFLLARTLDPDLAIPYAEVDVERLAREERITAPTYSGMTVDGTAISLAAGIVRPDSATPGRVAATDLSAALDTPVGSHFAIAADRGVVDTREGYAALTDGVTIDGSLGYVIETESLLASLDRTHAESGGRVTASGPLGELTAGRMILTQVSGGTYVLVFNEGVELIYDPGT